MSIVSIEVPDVSHRSSGMKHLPVLGQGRVRSEQELLAAIESATTWTVRDGQLDMHRADGERALWANAVAR
jgi:hypothetical protein